MFRKFAIEKSEPLVRILGDELPFTLPWTHYLVLMRIQQAICIKEENIIIGVMLFSRVHNMICCLAVSPQHRRKGVASRLLDTALHELDRGRNIIVSTFREGDMKGLAPRTLYKKYGFIEGELTTEFDYPNQIFVLKPDTQ